MDERRMDIEKFDFGDFSDGLVAAWRYAKTYPYTCCCPDCNKRAIKSHLLQQHPVLESISDDSNHLLQMVDNEIDPRSGCWNFYNQHKVGISNALQYKLFCSSHDSGLFRELEDQNSIPKSKRDCLLLAFRSACAVRHQEEHRLHIYEKQAQSSGRKNLMEDNSRIFIRRMSAVIDNLWKAINGNGDNYYFFRMIAMPITAIAASDCMTDEQDLAEHIMDETYNEPLNCLSINLIPADDKLLLLLGSDTRYDKHGAYKSIIESFPTGGISMDIHLGTLKGILLKCNNWCCSPRLYEDSGWKEFFDEYEELKVRSTLLNLEPLTN